MLSTHRVPDERLLGLGDCLSLGLVVGQILLVKHVATAPALARRIDHASQQVGHLRIERLDAVRKSRVRQLRFLVAGEQIPHGLVVLVRISASFCSFLKFGRRLLVARIELVLPLGALPLDHVFPFLCFGIKLRQERFLVPFVCGQHLDSCFARHRGRVSNRSDLVREGQVGFDLGLVGRAGRARVVFLVFDHFPLDARFLL